MLQAKYSIGGSIHYQCMDWRHVEEMMNAGNQIYSSLKNICVWDKGTAGMGSLCRSQHEFIFVFKNGIEPHINNVELGVHGRKQPAGKNFGKTPSDGEACCNDYGRSI